MASKIFFILITITLANGSVVEDRYQATNAAKSKPIRTYEGCVARAAEQQVAFNLAILEGNNTIKSVKVRCEKPKSKRKK